MSEKELVRGWLVSLARHVAVGVLGLLWLVLITRALPPEDVGVLILVVALPSLLVPMLNLGFPLGLSYLTAQGAFDAASLRTWGRSMGIRLAVLSAALLAGGVAIVSLAGVESDARIAWGLAAVPLATISAMGAAFYQGERAFTRQAQILVAPMALTLVMTVALVAFTDPTAASTVGVVVAAHLFTATWVLWQMRGGRSDALTEGEIRTQAWTFAWRAYLSEAAAAIRARLDLVAVGAVLGTASAATFGTASALAGQIALMSMAAFQVVFPFAAAASTAPAGPVDELTPKAARITVALTLGAGLIMALLGQPLLRLFYGEEFVDGWKILLAYLPSVVLLSLSRILTADLSGRGAIDIVLRISIVATAFGILALFIGIAVGGVVGAAIAASLTALLNTALRVRAYRRLTGFTLVSLVLPKRSDLSMVMSALRGRSHTG